MPYVTVGLSQIYYEERGAGVPVVLAHGVGGNHASWSNQIPALSTSYRTIVYDHRGFGNSSDIEQTGASSFIDDLLALLDALAIERAVLVGQSMGGGTCAGLTSLHPERVRALVLADTVSALTIPEDVRPQIEAAQEATRDLPSIMRVLGPRIREDHPEKVVLYEQIASFNHYRNMRDINGVQHKYTIEDLAATHRPIMFLVGADDLMVPPPVVRYLHSRVAGSRFAELKGAGHCAYLEAPDAFTQHLIGFLADVASLPPE